VEKRRLSLLWLVVTGKSREEHLPDVLASRAREAPWHGWRQIRIDRILNCFAGCQPTMIELIETVGVQLSSQSLIDADDQYATCNNKHGCKSHTWHGAYHICRYYLNSPTRKYASP
jgi:hypothetical protein